MRHRIFHFSEPIRGITILFVSSILLLTMHVLDDAFIVGEAAWYGISTAEFLASLVLIYGIFPPLGLYLVQRGKVLGFVILIIYTLQAFYGAGLNHVRHLMGDFRGSQALNSLLRTFDISVGNLNGQGFWSLLAGMLGLNDGVPPHTHSMFSNVVVFLSIAVNLTLMGFLLFALGQMVARQLDRRLGPV